MLHTHLSSDRYVAVNRDPEDTHTCSRTNQQVSNCAVKKLRLYIIRILKVAHDIYLHVGMEKNQPEQRT